jgi:hypothetical protein
MNMKILLKSIRGHEPMDYIIDQNEFTVKTMITVYLKTVAFSDLPNIDKRIKRSRYPYKGGQKQNGIMCVCCPG